MSTLVAIALAVASTVQPSCSWDNPGVNPYTGNSAAAIDRYTDLPESARRKLKRRIEYGNPDEMVTITRDAITGRHNYNPQIRDMHFGQASVCGTVTRSKWSATRAEPAAVYCAEGNCILVPKICGNISRISRLPVITARLPGQPAPNPRREWDIPESDLGLLDAPPAFDLATLPVMAPVVAPARPVLAAAPPAAPKDDWYSRPRPAPFNPGGGGTPGGHGSPGSPVKPGNPGNPVAPVPEPETYAMMLAGLGLLGYMARRKSRKS